MITVKELSLQKALQSTGLRSLPPKVQPKDIWIKAIALVRKANGVESYCLVESDGADGVVLKKDFGQIVCIAEYLEIYPFEVLDKKRTPDLRSNDAIIKFLSNNGYQSDVIAAMLSKDGKSQEQYQIDRKTVKSYVYKVAIALAKKTIAENERCEKVTNYKERIAHAEAEESKKD